MFKIKFVKVRQGTFTCGPLTGGPFTCRSYTCGPLTCRSYTCAVYVRAVNGRNFGQGFALHAVPSTCGGTRVLHTSWSKVREYPIAEAKLSRRKNKKEVAKQIQVDRAVNVRDVNVRAVNVPPVYVRAVNVRDVNVPSA